LFGTLTPVHLTDGRNRIPQYRLNIANGNRLSVELALV